MNSVRRLSTARNVTANHLVRLNAVSKATNEQALQTALNSKPTVDLKNLPAELSPIATFFSTGKISSSGKFVPNPNAWQNQGFFKYVLTEVTRKDAWPFFAGFASVFLLLGVCLDNALPESGKKNSKYIQYLEGNFSGHAEGHDAHHH